MGIIDNDLIIRDSLWEYFEFLNLNQYPGPSTDAKAQDIE